MDADRLKWDRKYQDRRDASAALRIVCDHVPEVTSGRALDLACGLGRHSMLMAERGFEVDAVDISGVALARVRHPRVHTLLHDLDRYQITPGGYDLIVATYFLDRNLWPAISAGLRSGGLLITETHLIEESTNDPGYRLRPNELLRAFPALRVLYYREHLGVAGLVARRQPQGG